MPSRRIPHLLRALHWSALAAVLGALSLRAALELSMEWDFLTIHLPGALRAWGLTSYTPAPRFLEKLEGAPPLAHWVQGALVAASGRPSSAALIGPIGLLGAAAAAARLHRTEAVARWLLTWALAIPLAVLHLPSGFIDLWTASLLLVAFGAWARIEEAGSTRFRWGALWLGLAGAALSKTTAWVPAAVIAGLATMTLARAALRNRRPARAAGAILLVWLALPAWPVRNLLVHGNPAFPQYKRQFGQTAERYEADAPHLLPPEERKRSRPARFVRSALEWTRLERPEVPFRRSVDMWMADESPHQRMGGWTPLTVGALVASLVVLGASGALPLQIGAGWAALAAAIAFCPQSHQLRYWLVIPLSAGLLAAAGRERAGRVPRAITAALALLAAAASLLGLGSPIYRIDPRPAGERAPPELRAGWARVSGSGTAELPLDCDIPYGIFSAGPTFREFPIRCL